MLKFPVDNSSNDDHFSDAQEGRSEMGDSDTTPSPTVPIPLTVISKFDDTPSHGGVPGTEAFEKRATDASADVIRIIDEAETPKKRSMNIIIPGAFDGSDCDADEDDGGVESTPETPKSSVPITIVERVDDVPTYGEVPGTEAFEKRLADAVPDVVCTPSPVPTMMVQRIEEDRPYHGEVPGTEAYDKRAADAQPDVIVRWNEEEDRITRRVQTQREKIERMVQGGGTPVVAPVYGRARSVSPSVSPTKETLYSPVHGRTRSASPSLGKEQEGSDTVKKMIEATTGDDKTTVVNGGFLDTPISTASLIVDLDAAENSIPDEFTLSPTFALDSENHPGSPRRKSSVASHRSRRSAPQSPAEFVPYSEGDDGAGGDGFGDDDDFDDFGEVVEGVEFDDFEGFGEETTDFEPAPVETPQPPQSPPAPVVPLIPVPVHDYGELDGADAIRSAVSESLKIMFPTDKKHSTKLASVEDSCFLTERR